MAISYPLSFPTAKGLARITLRGQSVVAVTEGDFSKVQFVFAHPGQIWHGDIAWPAMTRADAEKIITFLLKLNGQEGTFLMGDPNGATPRGSASSAPGTPLVDGGSQTGNTLAIKGAPAGATNYLRAGDYVQLETGTSSRLYKNLNDANTDSAGDLTIDIWPSLRTSPADNDPVVVSSAVGVWRLADGVMEWEIDESTFYGLSVRIIEAL